MGAFGTAGLVFFATGALLGFLVTALLPMSPETWWLWPLVRVLWQLGGALWCGWAIAQAIGTRRGLTVAGFGFLGFLLCFNAVFDLARGPLSVQGRILQAGFEGGQFWRPAGPSVTYNKSLHGSITMQDSAGLDHTVEPSGMQATRLGWLLEECSSEAAHMEALRHLDVVMELQCEAVTAAK